MIDVAVSKTLVPESKRLAITAALFGNSFPFQLEPAIFDVTGKLAPQYHGGYWTFYVLGNGGFYMAPDSDAGYDVYCPNGYEGHLSADAMGIVACLYAYSHLSFTAKPAFAAVCAEHYHLLREFVFEHPEARAILAATD